MLGQLGHLGQGLDCSEGGTDTSTSETLFVHAVTNANAAIGREPVYEHSRESFNLVFCGLHGGVGVVHVQDDYFVRITCKAVNKFHRIRTSRTTGAENLDLSF